jgi:predicted RNA binding protein YcfA (HicA-like mRNA interferase family)
MKRVDLIKTIEAGGCVLVRHGGRHDWYRNPVTGMSQPVPRHREIKEESREQRSEDGASGGAKQDAGEDGK